ncbi:hypothetical protein ACOJBM_29200 [Rhizobium beringeri]
MAKDAAKSGKTETLTIRLDPKTRFILEYMSRLKGQTITTVVERAIVAAAAQETVVDREYGGQLSWDSFWDVSEGVRALNLASRSEFFQHSKKSVALNSPERTGRSSLLQRARMCR